MGEIVPLIKFIPEDIEVVEIDVQQISAEGYAHVKDFLEAKSWRCECGQTNHGWNKKCANYRCQKAR